MTGAAHVRSTLLIIVIFVAIALIIVAVASHRSDSEWRLPPDANLWKNPVLDAPATREAARLIYAERCAKCHGMNGDGKGGESNRYLVRPTDFTDARTMEAMTDGEIFWKITQGRRPMPNFRNSLTDRGRWELVNYLRAFAKPPASPPSSAP